MAIDYYKLLNLSWGGNSVHQYLIAFGIFLASILILRIFKFFGIKKLGKLAKKTKTELDDLAVRFIDSIHWPFYVILSLYFSLQFINVIDIIDKAMYYVILVVITYYVVHGFQKAIQYSTLKLIQKRKKEEKGVDEGSVRLLGRLGGITLWVVAILFLLSNLGYDISTLIAGLGVGGIAIAFALQNIIADLFSSISIHLDKPFELGDFIIIGKDMGVVKKIGIKSTRITTLQGQELVVSNRELTSTRVNNYKKMQKRRIVFSFGVTYDTPVKKLKKIPEIMKGIVDKIKLADLDRAHFREFGDFSLNYEVVYYLNSKEYNDYMDTQQAINLALTESFQKEKIEFAYPTQTVYVNKA